MWFSNLFKIAFPPPFLGDVLRIDAVEVKTKGMAHHYKLGEVTVLDTGTETKSLAVVVDNNREAHIVWALTLSDHSNYSE